MRVLKRAFQALALVALANAAQAQNYPSPIFKGLTVTTAYPGLGTSNDVARFVVGGLPITDEYQGGGFSNNAIVGAISTPAGTFAGANIFDSGVSGYAQTAALGRSAVGLYGEGNVINTSSGSTATAWGINTEAVNCAGHSSSSSCGPGFGNDFAFLVSNEADLSIFSKSGGADPVITNGDGGFGYEALIFSNTPLASGYNDTAFYAGSSGTAFGSQEHVWDVGFTVGDGGATTGFELGATGRPAANLASQKIILNYYNSSAVFGYVSLYATSTGFLTTNSPLSLTSEILFTGSSSAFTPLNFVDTGVGGQDWYVGPGSGTGLANSFNIYDFTNTTTVLQISSAGLLTVVKENLSGVTTGTPVASLCLDASNNIIKKTTTGSCT